MSKFLRKSAGLVFLALFAGATPQLSAAVIYDNSVHDLTNRFNPGTFQVGNEINLAGTERQLTAFSFEYWGTNTALPDNSTFAGSVKAEVRFYLNDGAPYHGYATPGTMFYDSGLFAIGGPTARSTLNFNSSDFASGWLTPGTGVIPGDSITWTVTFSGMGVTDSVGLDLYGPATVGSNFDDYWINSAGWQLQTNSLGSEFATRFQAVVPEPSSITLSILGGIGLFVALGRMRRKQ
jgi:hypothetical protein